MTPEERIDKVEGDLARLREDHEKSIGGLRRLAYEYFKMNQADHRVFMAQHRALMVQHRVHMARHRARMAEIEAELQADRERQKAAEVRVDGVEETAKLLRELLEGNLRRPEKPPEATT